MMVQDGSTPPTEETAAVATRQPHRQGGTTTTKFDKKEYNVTDYGCQTLLCITCPIHFLPMIPGIMGWSKTMVLEEEEAILETNCQPFCTIHTRRPYGELGSIDTQYCLCCSGVSSDLSKSLPIFIGWGCNYDQVNDIVTELKIRMKSRGDTGQIERTEQALYEIQQLRNEMMEMKSDIKLIMKSLNVVQVVPPPDSATIMER